MRGILLGLTFFSLLPLVFVRGPFIGILLWFWVSLMDPQFVVWGPFATIRYALIVAVATLLAWFLSSEPKAPPLDRLTVLLILWMIWISITSLFGIGPESDVHSYWFLAEKMLLMTVVAYALTNTRERIDLLIAVCALSIGILGAKRGFWVLLGHTGRIEGPGGMIAGTNEFGLAVTTIVPLLIYLRMRWSGTWLKWPLTALAALNVIAGLFTYSRGALLSISAMLAVAGLRSRHKLISVVVVALLAIGMVEFAPSQWTLRMDSIGHYQKDASALIRLYMWRLGWAMAVKHPILGGGLHWTRNFAEVNREFAGSDFHFPVNDGGSVILGENHEPPLPTGWALHSIWLEALSEHGFPGLVIYVSFGLVMFFDSRWLMRRTRGRADLVWANNLGRVLQASLIGFAVGGSFASFDLYDGFYVLVLITAAARRVAAAELAKAAAPAQPVAVSAVPGIAGRASAAIHRGAPRGLLAANGDATIPRKT
jgi:probable O-glycosylation ligase (exosortase A-associated)